MCRASGARVENDANPRFRPAYAWLHRGLTCGRASGAQVMGNPIHTADPRLCKQSRWPNSSVALIFDSFQRHRLFNPAQPVAGLKRDLNEPTLLTAVETA